MRNPNYADVDPSLRVLRGLKENNDAERRCIFE
jgi:hypothetical protein